MTEPGTSDSSEVIRLTRTEREDGLWFLETDTGEPFSGTAWSQHGQWWGRRDGKVSVLDRSDSP